MIHRDIVSVLFIWKNYFYFRGFFFLTVYAFIKKPQNCLVNSNCDLKITDFGSAVECGTKDKIDIESEATTLWYRSPEMLMNTKRCTPAVDVWSVGCIFGELIAGKPLFKGCDASEQLALILDISETCGRKGSDPDSVCVYFPKSLVIIVFTN